MQTPRTLQDEIQPFEELLLPIRGVGLFRKPNSGAPDSRADGSIDPPTDNKPVVLPLIQLDASVHTTTTQQLVELLAEGLFSPTLEIRYVQGIEPGMLLFYKMPFGGDSAFAAFLPWKNYGRFLEEMAAYGWFGLTLGEGYSSPSNAFLYTLNADYLGSMIYIWQGAKN